MTRILDPAFSMNMIEIDCVSACSYSLPSHLSVIPSYPKGFGSLLRWWLSRGVLNPSPQDVLNAKVYGIFECTEMQMTSHLANGPCKKKV